MNEFVIKHGFISKDTSVVQGGFSANTISGGTIYSGSTDLYDIFLTTSSNDITRVQPGLNTYTGGTGNNPTVNISAATLTSLSATTISGGTLFSGSTDLYDIFLTTSSSDITRVQPGLNTYTGGTDSLPTVNISAATLTSLFASTISGGTLFSGSTNLYDIFSQSDTNDVTRVQPGLNTYTGGTDNAPTVNISAATLSSLSATTISGGTLFSGSTNLYDIFLTTNDGNDITRVQPGSNISTGGTANNPIINLVASPSINNLSFSGTATGIALSATTISGATLFSGSTNLYSIFSTSDTNDITRVQPGSNINTGGTENAPTVNLVASPSINGLTFSGTAIGNALSATTLSGGTLYSGSTNLYDIFSTSSGSDVTRVQPGSNISTGGTGNLPTISLVDSPSLNSVILSGVSSLGTFSATTISGTTFISGSTNLYSIFAQPSFVVNNINAGSNITTGGTSISPIINLTSSPSINNITSSGSSQLNIVTAVSISGGTLSGGTIFSGSTNLYDIFATSSSSDTTRVQPGSNISTGGTGNLPTVNLVASPSINGLISSGESQLNAVTAMSISGGTLSGGTLFSGSTNLYDIFAQQGGSGEANTASNLGAMGFFAQKSGVDLQFKGFSAGTNMLVTSSSTENAVAVSSTPIFTSVSATTLSGGTIFSGSTNLGSVFLTSAMSAYTIKGNNTSITANAVDLTKEQTMVLLDYYGKTLSIHKGNFTF